MAKSLTWSDDGMSTTDGRYVIGAVHGTDGQPAHFFWERCPKLKVKAAGHREIEHDAGATTVREVEVVEDDRPYGCDTLAEMHEQADAMNRSGQALARFEGPRTAARQAAKAQRRQDAEDAQMDALVAKLLERPGFAEELARRIGVR